MLLAKIHNVFFFFFSAGNFEISMIYELGTFFNKFVETLSY